MRSLWKIVFLIIVCLYNTLYAQENNIEIRADQINEKALSLQKKAKYSEAILQFKNALKLYNDEKLVRKATTVMTSLGSCYMLSAKYDSAYYFHRLAINSQEDIQDKLGIGNSLLSIGNVHLYQSNYDSALVYYNDAVTVFIETSDSLKLASVYNNIGAIHNYIGNVDQVIEYWERSLKIKVALKNDKAIAVSKNNLAELYLSNNELTKAEENVLDAIKLKEKESSVESLATSYFNLSEIYKLQNRSEESFKILQKTQKLINQSTSAYLQAELNNKLGNYYSSKSLYKSAIFHFEKARDFAEGGKVNDIYLSVLKSLEEVYYSVGNYRKALNFSSQYYSLKDSLLGERQQEKILELEAKYESKNKAQDIKLLQANNALHKSLNEKYYFRIVYLLLGVVLLLSITFLLWRNVYLKRKNNDLLAEKNKQIQTDLERKNFLIKEIHHRIKNNLSIIDSLINLQLISKPDIDPSVALSQAQHRIRSISLLYDLLYKSANFEELTFTKYIDQLTENLYHSLGFKSRNILIVKELQEVKLSKDNFINFGLIINELFTNASKYGFPQKGGKIFLQVTKNNSRVKVIFYHNGKQLHTDILANKSGLGIQLIRGLTNQMKGSFTVEESQFTKFIFIFEHE